MTVNLKNSIKSAALIFSLISGPAVFAQSNLPELPPGGTATGTVTEGQQVPLLVNGPMTLTLRSLNGDADLFVIDRQENILCRSENAGAENDVCDVPSGEHITVVLGYAASTDFELTASGSGGGGGDSDGGESDGGEADFSELQGLEEGQTGNGTLSAEQQVAVRVTGPTTVTLNSLAGDADLYIVNTSRDIVCQSDNRSSSSTIDSCDVPSGVHAAVIVAVTDVNFEITVGSGGGSGTGPGGSDGGGTGPGGSDGGGTGPGGSDSNGGGNDDGGVRPEFGGSGGGGALNLLWAGLLLVAVRRRGKIAQK